MNFTDNRHGAIKPAGNHASVRTTGLLLGVPLVMLLSSLSIVQAAHADTKKPAVAASATNHAALLLEVRKNLTQSGKYSASDIEGIIAELRNKSMIEIQAMVDFAGSKATGADRLIAGSGSDARDRAGELTGRSGVSGTSGSASERGINQALTPGVNDTRGQTSSCSACDAAPEQGFFDWLLGSKERNGADQLDSGAPPTPKGATHYPASNGDHIYVFKDKSVSIVRRGKETEYLNSNQRLVDSNGNAKEPRPDGDKSGGFTAADVRRVAALLGSKSEPDPNSSKGGTGGGVDSTRTNRTGTVGLYTESATGTYTSKADVLEIIRISVEKLQGPQVGK